MYSQRANPGDVFRIKFVSAFLLYGVGRKCEEMLGFYSKWPKLAFFSLKLSEFDDSGCDFSADFQRTNRFVPRTYLY